MAHRIGIVGGPNTGKSFSRRNLKNGSEAFVLSPSQKVLHLYDKDGDPVKRLNVSTQKSPSMEALLEAMKVSNRHSVVLNLMRKNVPAKYTGHWEVVHKINYLKDYMDMVDRHMPHIKYLFLPDFTHYISRIVASKEFMDRNSGGQAFARFWDLAADALNSFFIHSDTLREDLFVITEFHSEYNQEAEEYKIFIPSGKMLGEKFLPDSYFDIMLYTHIEKDEQGEVTPDSYKFVTRRWGKYNARSMDIFEDKLIPNDMQLVLDTTKKALGIT
ncbi:MAG TPA: hypothetical protein DCY51_07485 [Bacteroidetes bacterium]|nr:hypothetical protein [Bacteroidota bacterium]